MFKKIKIIPVIFGVGFFVLLALVLMLLHMITVLDWSQQKPYPVSTSEQKNTDYYLISYADGPEVFFQNRNILAASAINRGFDFILNYKRDHIDGNYIAKHPILQERTGGGYWLWKPYLILKTLQQIPDGSIVMYADSGLLIRQPLRQYLEKNLTKNKDIVLFAYDPMLYGKAARCATRETFIALNCNEDRCRYGHHVWAGIVVVRNSAQSRAFIAQWLKYCERPNLLKGITSNTENYPEFSHHQHDEGILSVIGSREAKVVNFVPMDKVFFKYINMHRRKTNEKSLLGAISIEYFHIERKLPNWWLVSKLRNIMCQSTAEAKNDSGQK